MKLPKKGDLTKRGNWRGANLLFGNWRGANLVFLQSHSAADHEQSDKELKEEPAGFRGGTSYRSDIPVNIIEFVFLY